MTDISIDSSKLPGVKEVCRDFAVLEDHSLAHTLQEQEIEHHLATNIQRNRLAKYDLKVAKQLQEEEDLKAQSKNKHRHNELEDLDGEIAQEIQEKLVIEAEIRRRQEEKDEDIARLLQEREEKRRKKYNPPHGTEEPYYPDHGGHHRGRPKEHMSEFDRHHRHERPERRKEESHPKSKQGSHCDDDRKRGRSAEPRSGQGENSDLHRSENRISRTSDKKEKPDRPPPPRTNRHEQPEDKELGGAYSSENVPRKGRSQSHDLLSTNNADVQRRRHSPSSPSDRRGTESANERGKPRRRVDSDYEHERPRRRVDSDYEHEKPRRRVDSDYEHERPRRRAESEYEHERPRTRPESEYEHERHGKGAEGENEHEGHRRRAESKSAHEKHRRRTPSPNHERQPSDGGNRPKGHRDGPHIGGRIRDEDDAEIARRLQEEELRVNTVDYKTAQLAQDEEIARWLMEKEQKSYKKSKGRDKERRRADEQELNTPERVRLRSKDEHHCSRSDKPYRPLPPPPDEDYNDDCSNDYVNRSSHSSPRPSSKSQSSNKGSHHRQ